MLPRLFVTLLYFTCLLCTPAAQCDFYTDIRHAFPPDEVKTLMVGESSNPIIEIASQTPLSLGTAVIFSEPFPSSITISQANIMANQLAQKGWNVIISPFDFPVAVTLSKDADLVTQDQNTGNENALPVHPQSDVSTQAYNFDSVTMALTSHITSLNNYLQDRQGYRLVIVQGMLAGAYMNAVNVQEALQPDSLVAISPFWPQRENNNLVIKLISQSDYPVLDIALGGFNDWAGSTDYKRQNRSKVELKLHYRQVKLPGKTLTFSIKQKNKNLSNQILTNNILGWTRHLGW